MSFLKRLFGGGTPKPSSGKPVQVGDAVEHKGYTIRATPFAAEGQYQTCGVISREVEGTLREHSFIRADRCPTPEDAADLAIRKGIQMVDQLGDGIFRD